MNDNKYNFFCGIDVSKKTLDFTLINIKKEKIFHIQVDNSNKGINKVINHIKDFKIEISQVLFCCENTGLYHNKLSRYMYTNNHDIWIENAYTISRSLGLTRGKNDCVDSLRIAKYASTNLDKCKLWIPKSKSLQKLQHLYSNRERLINCLRQLKNGVGEIVFTHGTKYSNSLSSYNEKSINALKSDIKNIDKEIEDTIKDDENLNKSYKIAKSVPCVGKVTSLYLLICTDNYSKIDNYRKAACYAGIAPYEHRSGTSIRGKTRISHLGNKVLKKLLHICTLSVLKQKKGELYEYYLRKKNEGKNTMSILNSLRNKLLNRIFACVTKGVKYEPIHVNHLCQLG